MQKYYDTTKMNLSKFLNYLFSNTVVLQNIGGSLSSRSAIICEAAQLVHSPEFTDNRFSTGDFVTYLSKDYNTLTRWVD